VIAAEGLAKRFGLDGAGLMIMISFAGTHEPEFDDQL
jgi:hypothetical protein